MPTVSVLQSSFNGGELSPSLLGRLDADRYKSSVAKMLNYTAFLQGPADRRPGTYRAAETKDSSKTARLIPFQFSTSQAYILEFGDLYIRFFTNHGEVLSGMAIYEIATPFTEADVPFLNFTQSGDVLYLMHINFPPKQLERRGATDWRLVNVDFQDGPYLPTNITDAELQASATTGTGITIASPTTKAITNVSFSPTGEIRVVSANHKLVTGTKIFISGVTGTIEANNSASSNWTITYVDADTFDLQGSIFVNAYVAGGTVRFSMFNSLDVGRLIRLKATTNWGWGIIKTVTNQYTVTVDIKQDFDGVGVTKAWRLGVWCPLNGYPTCVTFHEDRLCFSGAPVAPQRIDCSKSSDYITFSPTEVDGTVQDNNALSFSLNSNDVNQMQWIASDEKGMVGGSKASEWVIRASINQEAMTPTNITAKKTTAWGSSRYSPFQVGKATMFIQRGGKKVRELLFYFDIDGYRSTDLTELSEHISGKGFTGSAYTKIPQSILWFVREDGALIGMTYERDAQNLRVGWHRHQLGGYSDSSGSPAIVESIASIPSPDGTYDELWMIVKRYINGGIKRYVEYMGKFFEDTDLQEEAHFLDCGAVYDVPKTITAITQASPGVVTSAAHGFSNNDQVVIRAVKGMSELNYNRYTVKNVAANTFELYDSDGNAVDTSAFSAYVSDGAARKLVTTISGLSWLEGETVSILADGGVVESQIVSGGSITLPLPSATVHVGYGYNSDLQLLRLDAGSANGTSLGKTRRIHKANVLVHRSLGLSQGVNENLLDPIIFRTDPVPPNRATPLFTGLEELRIDADYDTENQLFFRQSDPLPSKILAVSMQLQTQDGA